MLATHLPLSPHLPGTRFSLLASAVAVATLLALLTTAQAGAALAYEGGNVPWNGLLRAQLVDWYCYALFLPALLWLVPRRPILRTDWHLWVAFYLLLGLPIAVAKEALYVSIGNFFRPGMFSLPDILSEDFSSELLTAWALIGIVHLLASHERRRVHPAGAADAGAHAAVNQISVREGGAYRLVERSEVLWIEAQGNYARITTSRGRFLIRETMTRLERRLGPEFCRVHRRIIVNLDKVEEVEPLSHAEYRFVLTSGESIISGRSYNQRVRSFLRR